MAHKTLLSTIIVLCLIFLGGCAKNNVATIKNGKVTLKLKQCSSDGIDPVICFEDLVYDSRCPEGVACIWSGDAIVELSMKENGNKHRFRLALFGTHVAGHPKDTTIAGYKITFEDLLPHKKIGEPGNERPTAILSIN